MNLLQRNVRFLFHFPEDGGSGSPAPGTVDEVPPVDDAGTPAGATITDTAEAPGPIPYSRFKEVNDTRRKLEEAITPYRELEGMGYSPEDFRRLVAWEDEYAADPVGWALNNALEQATDSGVKAAIESAIAAKTGGSAETPSAPEGSQPDSGSDDEPPAWAKRIIEKHEREEREAEMRARSEAFDALTNAWKELDKKDNVKSPTEAALTTWLYAAAAQHSEPVEILRAARQSWLAEREEILKEAVTPARDGDTIPRPVPGGGEGAATVREPVRPRTLDQARKLAQEADERGTLVLDPRV
jgi:hypothetical protein